MVKKNLLMFLFAAGFLSILIAPAAADRRSYVWTYEHATMPKGEAEIEYYHTLEYPSEANPKISTWKQNVEFEYGLTDRWDISLYQNFKQTNTAAANTFAYDGWKLRTRYRLSERGDYIIDPLLYLEYQGPNDLSKAGVLEGKIILAKDISKLNLAYNQIFKQELKGDGASQNEYAAGASLEFNPAFKLGLEAKGSYTSGKHYVGPTVSFAREKGWINIGFLRGIGNGADQMQSRLLMGIYI